MLNTIRHHSQTKPKIRCPLTKDTSHVTVTQQANLKPLRY